MNLNKVYHVVSTYNRFNRYLKHHDVLGCQMSAKSLKALKIIMKYRDANQFPMTIKDLRKELGDDAQYTSKIMNRLRDQGLVTKERKASDERTVYILMNNAQYQKANAVVKESQSIFDKIWEGDLNG